MVPEYFWYFVSEQDLLLFEDQDLHSLFPLGRFNYFFHLLIVTLRAKCSCALRILWIKSCCFSHSLLCHDRGRRERNLFLFTHLLKTSNCRAAKSKKIQTVEDGKCTLFRVQFLFLSNSYWSGFSLPQKRKFLQAIDGISVATWGNTTS